MAARLVEYFGHRPTDVRALHFAQRKHCPFVNAACIKPDLGGCALEQRSSDPIVICPNRLYAESFAVLTEIARQAFGPNAVLTKSVEIARLKANSILTGNEVAVFGRHWGSELSIPQPPNSSKIRTGGFFVDYILAQLSSDGSLSEFVAVEVQTVDITGSYADQSAEFLQGKSYTDLQGRSPGWSEASLNWSNVSKRILPQLIYKGSVLRREKLCRKGLFFVCPTPVLQRVRNRLGHELLTHPIGPGTITFQTYDLGPEIAGLPHRPLSKGETFTTTIEQVAYAFVSPVNLPEMGVYEGAINKALSK